MFDDLPAAATLAAQTAEAQARAHADKAREVQRAILEAHKAGKTGVKHDGHLPEPIVRALRGKGYHVQHESGDQRDPYSITTISWGAR